MKSIRMALFIPLLAISASAQDVRYNFAGDVNFSKYKSFKWVQMKGADQLDQIADGQVKKAVDEELAKKRSDPDGSRDCGSVCGLPGIARARKRRSLHSITAGVMAPDRDRGYGYGGGGFSTSTTSTITIGQVDLDIYDAAAKKLVWRGTASKTLDMKAKPEKREKNLRKGVEKLC